MKLTQPWRWAVDSPVWLKPRRTVYFLTREVEGRTEYLNNSIGRLHTWKTQEVVKKAEKKVNLPS
jgi:hypothetical protein